MANLVDTIQKNLQYPPLKKVDPNTQDIKHKFEETEVEKIGQAAIPAVLTGLYMLSRNDEGCLKIMNTVDSANALTVIFQDHEAEVIQRVTHYTGLTANQAKSHLESIADESLRVVNEIAAGSCEKLKHYMNDQRHNILVCLPAALTIGDFLKDEHLDDKTNKMEGPVSNFIHRIENLLSQGGH
jgi:hypothetical protein